ncbi:hypothetical protein L2E82_50284 [Cichorium intybus]|nr:hypothetical protein L2E82_50284 [Cichorium intybus]
MCMSIIMKLRKTPISLDDDDEFMNMPRITRPFEVILDKFKDLRMLDNEDRKRKQKVVSVGSSNVKDVIHVDVAMLPPPKDSKKSKLNHGGFDSDLNIIRDEELGYYGKRHHEGTVKEFNKILEYNMKLVDGINMFNEEVIELEMSSTNKKLQFSGSDEKWGRLGTMQGGFLKNLVVSSSMDDAEFNAEAIIEKGSM